MTETSWQSYNAVIAHTVNAAISNGSLVDGKHKISGICHLLGPTGGGKSSALYRTSADGIPCALETLKSHSIPSILITHRWNILQDIYKSITEHRQIDGTPLSASIIYANSETVISAVTQTKLPHEINTNPTLPCPFETIKLLVNQKVFEHEDTSLETTLNKACRKLIKLTDDIAYIEKGNRSAQSQIDEQKMVCANIESALLANMKRLEDEYNYVVDIFGASHESTFLFRDRLQLFRSNAWIRRIFPAIAWLDDKQHILIMTTQKLYHSFYDGKVKTNIYKSSLSDYAIFVDEFDYQADVLSSLIAESQVMNEPTEFIGQLIESGKRLLARRSEISNKEINQFYEELAKLTSELEKDLAAIPICLQTSRAIVTPVTTQDVPSQLSHGFIYRADHLISSGPLPLKQTINGLELLSENKEEATTSIGDVARITERYTRKLCHIIKNASKNSVELYNDIAEIIHRIFDPSNDNRVSHYSRIILSLAATQLPKNTLSELKDIANNNKIPNTRAYMNGFACWRLYKKPSLTDPHKVDINRASAQSTPEALMVALASSNLVFTLSATSYIERALGNFDIRWMKNALEHIAKTRRSTRDDESSDDSNTKKGKSKPSIPYLQNNDDEEQLKLMIQHIIKTKREARQCSLTAITHDYDSELKAWVDYSGIEHLNLTGFFSETDTENSKTKISDTKANHRKSVFGKLLLTIEQTARGKKHQGHLVFADSKRFLQKWIKEELQNSERLHFTWIQPDDSIKKTLTTENPLNKQSRDFHFLRVHNVPVIICLMDAQTQKTNTFKAAYQAAFDTGANVIIITQLSSSTNGINLDYIDRITGNQKDIGCLYILEMKHYFFSSLDMQTGTQSNEEAMSHVGTELLKLQKCAIQGYLQPKKHMLHIETVMSNSQDGISRINSEYKESDDYIKNVCSDIQQIVGRIERSWSKTGNAEIHISAEIESALAKFYRLPLYCSNAEIISDFNNDLLRQADANSRSKTYLVQKLMTKKQLSETLKQFDEQIAKTINLARKDAKVFAEFSRFWTELGNAALKLELKWKPYKPFLGIHQHLFEWACIEVPSENSKDDEFFYDPHTCQFFNDKLPGTLRYDINKAYDAINSNSVIASHFVQRGFRTSTFPFANEFEERYRLHPHFFQRILLGRLGEEAIKALLKDNKLACTTGSSHNSLFEVYDLKIENTRFRVDAKYLSLSTMNETDATFAKWLDSDRQIEPAPHNVIEKITKIRRVEGMDTVLIIANLITNEEDGNIRFFTEDLNPAPAQDAAIITLSGCLSSKGYDITTGFKQLLTHIQNDTAGANND